MTLVEALQILKKQKYISVFPQPQQHSDYDFAHPERLLNPQQLEYCHAIDFITTYLKQRLLSYEDQKNIKEFLLNTTIDLLHRKWVMVSLWHIYAIYDNENRWFWDWFCLEKEKFPEEHRILYRPAYDDEKYLDLCSKLERGTFFPAQLLYSEYLSHQATTKPHLQHYDSSSTLGNVNAAWLSYYTPLAAVLLRTAKKTGEFFQTAHPHTQYLLESPNGRHANLHAWLRKNSSQYRAKAIEQDIEQYFKELHSTNVHNKARENRIIHICHEQTKIFGDVAGYYYLAIFYYLVAATSTKPLSRYEHYKTSFEFFLWVRARINLTYKHPSNFFNTIGTLANAIIQFADKRIIDSKKPIAHHLPNFITRHPSLYQTLLPNGLLLTDFSWEQKQTLDVLLSLLKNEVIACSHNIARNILKDNLERHFLTFKQRIELSVQASLLPVYSLQYQI